MMAFIPIISLMIIVGTNAMIVSVTLVNICFCICSSIRIHQITVEKGNNADCSKEGLESRQERSPKNLNYLNHRQYLLG
jgi:hypothetical protein